MSFIKRLLKKNPQLDYLKGRDAFAEKNYLLALKYFKKAYSGFSDQKMKITCLINAATSAEHSGIYEVAGKYYFESVKQKASRKEPIQEILPLIEKTYYVSKKTDNTPVPLALLSYLRFLSLLASKNLSEARSLVEARRYIKNNEYIEAMVKTIDLIDSKELKSNGIESIEKPNYPKEFNFIYNKAIQYITGITSCNVKLSIGDTQIIEKGHEFQATVEINTVNDIKITEIVLKTGNRGRASSKDINLPFTLAKDSTKIFTFTVTPLLSGQWKIGPVILKYSSIDEKTTYEIHSNIVTIEVIEAKPQIKVEMSLEPFTESGKTELRCQIINSGLTTVQNLRINIKLPETVTIIHGLPEKIITALNENENFDFSLAIQIDNFGEKSDSERVSFIEASVFLDNNKRIARSSIQIPTIKSN